MKIRQKECEICGELFVPTSGRQKICGKAHFIECSVCGKSMLWNSLREPPSCSKECSIEKRRRTNLMKYGVDNVRKTDLFPRSNGYKYDNFKYTKSIDNNYSELWASFGIDVWSNSNNLIRSRVVSPGYDIEHMQSYVIYDGMIADDAIHKFWAENGVNSFYKKRGRGVTLNLHRGSEICYAIRLEKPHFKNFSAQLVNLGALSSLDLSKGCGILIDQAIELYEIGSIVASVDNYTGLELDMRDMGFSHEMDRPGLVMWNGSIQYKRSDNIQEMLNQGNIPIVGPIRKLFVRTA